MMNINETMKQLAEYNRIAEETAQIIDALKETIKAYMTEQGVDTINGDEHKAMYREVAGNRIDTAALKRELPEVAARYTLATATMRFTFA